mmetsp:Transcript_24615/g.22373  ORF Transcript_24615/g.22373 Transcript_24615/m.22373 type:complete len:172 (+) Transcript_24615:129-644(+)
MRVLGCSIDNKIKFIAYMLLALTCVMNWFVAAYQPISIYFTKKGLKQSTSSGILKQVMRYIPVVSSTGTLSITRTHAMRVEKENYEHENNPFLQQIISVTNLLGLNSSPEKKKKIHSKNLTKKETNNYIKYESTDNLVSKDGHVVGFMDYDPKSAAITSHKSYRSKSNWFQ